MPNTALAFKDEYDEVPVSSTEVLEANVAALSKGLDEFKLEVREGFKSVNNEIKLINGEIKSIRQDLHGEIKSVNGEIKSLRQELHSEIKSLREDVQKEIEALRVDVDNGLKALSQQINSEIKSLREETDKKFENLTASLGATNQKVAELRETVVRMESSVRAIVWIWGGLGGVIALITWLGHLFHWF